MRIYLDMDGVLVDYPVAIAKFFEVPLDKLYENWPVGVYAIYHAIDRPDAEVWDAIRKAPDTVWTSMPEHAWARSLFDKCNETADTYVLSSPINSPTCVSGKVKWLHAFAGESFYKYILTHFKTNCARWDHILIDDKEQNVTDWETYGGEAILFPHHGNRLHALKKDPMSYVLPELERVQRRIACKAAERAALLSEMT